MSEEDRKDPTWKASSLGPMESTIVKLESAKEAATDESKYGTWWLWPIVVENVEVVDRETKKVTKGYSGKAIMFPSEKLQEQFIKHTNGTKEGVKVQITMVPKKNKRGSLYTEYVAKLVEDGKTPEGNVLEAHNKFLSDFKKFVDNKIVAGTEEDFKNFATSDTYGIPIDSVDKLWKVYKEG